MLDGEDDMELRLGSKVPDEALEYPEDADEDALEGCRKGAVSAVWDCRSGCGLYEEDILSWCWEYVLPQPGTVTQL